MPGNSLGFIDQSYLISTDAPASSIFLITGISRPNGEAATTSGFFNSNPKYFVLKSIFSPFKFLVTLMFILKMSKNLFEGLTDSLTIEKIHNAAFDSGFASRIWKKISPEDYFKYICLESYEDTLNNLELKRTDKQEQLLLSNEMSKKAKEEYMLSYMLDVESKGSLLNINTFKDPFNYKLNIATGSVCET